MNLKKVFENIYYMSHLDKLMEMINDPEHLWEMSNAVKRFTGLLVNVYIDEVQTYTRSGHYKRIKFQLDHANKFSNNLVNMDLDGNIFPKKAEQELSAKDIQEIRNFVSNNREILDLVADQEIDSEDFRSLMIKGGDKATPLESETQKKELQTILDTYRS